MARITDLVLVFAWALTGCSDTVEPPSGGPVVAHVEPLAVWTGSEALDLAGRSLAAYDIDGDGIDEVFVGAPSTFVEGNGDEPQASVYQVGPPGWNDTLDAVAEGFLAGARNGDNVGLHVAVSPDMTQDGRADLIIFGALSEDPAATVGVWSGSLSGPNELEGLHTRFLTDVQKRPIGNPVACGDMNGDGTADLCLDNNGQPQDSEPGSPYVKVHMFRGPLAPGGVEASDAEVQLLGTYEQIGGFGIQAGGDPTGDGLPDLIVGADESHGRRGAVYLLSNPPDGVHGVDELSLPVWVGCCRAR